MPAEFSPPPGRMVSDLVTDVGPDRMTESLPAPPVRSTLPPLWSCRDSQLPSRPRNDAITSPPVVNPVFEVRKSTVSLAPGAPARVNDWPTDTLCPPPLTRFVPPPSETLTAPWIETSAMLANVTVSVPAPPVKATDPPIDMPSSTTLLVPPFTASVMLPSIDEPSAETRSVPSPAGWPANVKFPLTWTPAGTNTEVFCGAPPMVTLDTVTFGAIDRVYDCALPALKMRPVTFCPAALSKTRRPLTLATR